MKLEQRDLAKLQWYALLAIAAGVWSTTGAGKARAERDAAALRQAQTQQRLSQVRTEEQDIKERTRQYQQMEQAGVTGPEKRLDWTELLRDLQRQLRLPGMTYEFGPQLALETGPAAGYAYHSSQLKIQLRLLHEEDLLRFLGRLQREARAMIIIRSCRLAPAAVLAQPGDNASILLADCELQWVTLRRANGKGE